MVTLNRRTVLAGAAAFATSTALIGRAGAATSIDLSTAWPEGNPHTENAKAFAAKIAEATNGEVNITVHSGGSLGFKGPEHLRAVRDGLVPMADVLATQQVGDVPFLGIENLPFLLSSADDLRALHKYARPKFEEIAAEYNQKILYMAPWSGQAIYLKVETDKLEDFAGIKIRTADKNTLDLVNSLGMSGVLIPWGELAQALATGRVDGVSTSVISGVDGKFWEFLDYIYPTDHTWASQMVTINLDTWNGLGADAQSTIEQVGKDMEAGFWANSIGKAEASKKILVENGMTMVDIPADMMAEMQERTAPIREEFVERVPDAGPIIDAYLKDVGRK